MARVLDHRVKELFPDGAVERAELLRDGDVPGELTVRVFIPATEDLAAWAVTHRERMEELRRELSLRLPSARLLEFTSGAPDAPVISVPDDGSLAAEQLPSRDIVVKALALLRENYVFPELAGQAATAVETRLAAGEYDNLDEITLSELLTSHLQDATGDKHLRVRLGGGPGPGRRRAKLIGETTGGGAHPTRPFPISAAVHIAIPFARSINPVTGTNWQGTGVIPDIPVPADDAYRVAYAKALRHVAGLGDVPPPIADEARDALATLTD